MKFGPLLESCIPLKMFQMGDGIEGILLHQIKSRGEIEYIFIFSVFKDKQPIMYYSAERHADSKKVFIGVFDNVGHKNLGIDTQCEDQMVFLMKALEYVSENYL